MLISIVIPVLNEAEALPLLLASLRQSLRAIAWEAIFIDDGSADGSAMLLEDESLRDGGIRLIRFSRNFGHQAAVTAGLDFANGDAVVVMDADLQDPPELLPSMIDLFCQGYDVVSPQRVSRQSDTLFKRWSAKLFYQLISRLAGQALTPEVGDFRLFSRRAVLAIRGLREQHRYMRGLVGWLGLKEAFLPFDRSPRCEGRTKYSLFKMLRFAWTGISSFSAYPLRISITVGCLLSGAGFLYLLRVLYDAVFTHSLVPGWASVVALQCIFSGVILLALGAIGDYVARTYEETKNRPLYVVSEARNIDFSAENRQSPARAIILRDPRPSDPFAHPLVTDREVEGADTRPDTLLVGSRI